jgi:hypothetical protein
MCRVRNNNVINRALGRGACNINMGTLTAAYDLGKSPPTHDLVNWLVRVEKARIGGGFEAVEIVIVPGERMFTERDFTYSRDRKLWRARTLLVPLCYCLPSVTSVRFGRGEQTITYANPNEPQRPTLKAPPEAGRIVESYLKGIPRPISITLRQSEFELERNSNALEWLTVANCLKQDGYTPIIVHDTEALMAGREHTFPFRRYDAAAFEPTLRLALYERCEMNLMTNSGPMVLALNSEAPVTAFKMIIPGFAARRSNIFRLRWR